MKMTTNRNIALEPRDDGSLALWLDSSCVGETIPATVVIQDFDELARVLERLFSRLGVPVTITGQAPPLTEPVRYYQVEYDLAYAGGDYSGVGQFAYVHAAQADLIGVEKVFEATTGFGAWHIISYSTDEHYTAEGERMED